MNPPADTLFSFTRIGTIRSPFMEPAGMPIQPAGAVGVRGKVIIDEQYRDGVFATRAPRRPNAIGLSIVRLIEVNGCELVIEDVDVLDGTPLLDIKPYVPAFDCFPDEKSGWLAGCSDAVSVTKSDHRFQGSHNNKPER